VKRVIKAILEPFAKVFRVFFDPRFDQLGTRLEGRLDEIDNSNSRAIDESRATVDAITESLTFLNRNAKESAGALNAITQAGGRFDQLEGSLKRHDSRLGELVQSLERHVTSVPQSLESLQARDAVLLNRGESYEPFAGERGLWFNPPITLRYSAGDVEVRDINERIVEVPFVFETIGILETGARILDVGCAESTVSFSLASLGYDVTGIDLHPYPLRHPNLTSVATPLEEWKCSDAYFDGVVCLSSIEHFGIGAYGEDQSEGLDKVAMEMITRWAKPGAMMALTVPFGPYRVTDVQRVYDLETLNRLLEGWTIKDFRTALRLADGSGWSVVQGDRVFGSDEVDIHPAIVMVAATRDN
jgi:SAM-dependent methyltransferase